MECGTIGHIEWRNLLALDRCSFQERLPGTDSLLKLSVRLRLMRLHGADGGVNLPRSCRAFRLPIFSLAASAQPLPPFVASQALTRDMSSIRSSVACIASSLVSAKSTTDSLLELSVRLRIMRLRGAHGSVNLPRSCRAFFLAIFSFAATAQPLPPFLAPQALTRDVISMKPSIDWMASSLVSAMSATDSLLELSMRLRLMRLRGADGGVNLPRSCRMSLLTIFLDCCSPATAVFLCTQSAYS